MAANYWSSTQFLRWQTTKAALAQTRQALEDSEAVLVTNYALPDRRLLSAFFKDRTFPVFFMNGPSIASSNFSPSSPDPLAVNTSRNCPTAPQTPNTFNSYTFPLTLSSFANPTELHRLAAKLKIRQQAIATAQVYLRRFYTKVEIRRTNPYTVLTTALYLACKMEECPHHIKSVASEARLFWPEFIQSDISKIGEYEFWLISEMNCQMIVHHPYRTLTDLQKTLGLVQDEVSLAWSIVNDHYMTDLPLLYPPHLIAVTAIFLALVLKPGTQGSGSSVGANNSGSSTGPSASLAGVANLAKGGVSANAAIETAFQGTPQEKVQYLVKWLAEGTLDIKGMIECTQEIISLYEVLEGYGEKTVKEQLARFARSR